MGLGLLIDIAKDKLNQLDKLSAEVGFLSGFIGEKEDQVNHLRETIDNCEKKTILFAKSMEVMKKLIELMSSKGIENLKKLLSFGLKTIFNDRDYAVEIEISERGNVKTAEFFLEEIKDGERIKVRLRDAAGGGIQTVVALIMMIYFIISLELRRLIILDEALSQVSDTYVENLFKFMKQTSDELGFKFLLVTHDPRFLEYADRIYRMKMGRLAISHGK